jgi:H+/Cl- antiporter ClcA
MATRTTDGTRAEDQDEPLLNLSNLTTPLTPIQQQQSVITRESIAQLDAETKHQLTLIKFLGRPYAARSFFWTRLWPLSLILGAFLGLLTAAFVELLNVFNGFWFTPEAKHGPWWWMAVTSGGGLLGALILIFPGAPRPGMTRTIYHDARDLKGSPVQTPFLVISCLVTLATGAPLGPETAIGALGSGLAAFLTKRIGFTRRDGAVLIQSCLVGSLAGLFLSPILAVALVHELSVSGRPMDFLIDSLVASEQRIPRDVLVHSDHDYMEQIVVAGTAATTAHVVLHLVAPSTYQWFQIVELGTPEAFALWHLAAAIPIGLVCGKFGMLATGLMGLFRYVRVATCEMLHERLHLPKAFGWILFPALAGAIHGLFTIWHPKLAGSGIDFLVSTIQQDVTFSNVPWIMLTAVSKMVAMALCLGFGMVGGQIFPMIFIGLCLGMGMTPLVPISLAVPSCMAATLGSFFPAPITLVLYVAFTLSLSVKQIGPVFVATFIAFTLVGGSGVSKKLGEKHLGYVAPEVDFSRWERQNEGGEEEVFQYEALDDEEEEKQDEEITREIATAVFGDVTPLF